VPGLPYFWLRANPPIFANFLADQKSGKILYEGILILFPTKERQRLNTSWGIVNFARFQSDKDLGCTVSSLANCNESIDNNCCILDKNSICAPFSSLILGIKSLYQLNY
jgi:hypothetical protein